MIITSRRILSALAEPVKGRPLLGLRKNPRL
jgi:hypothetical protein